MLNRENKLWLLLWCLCLFSYSSCKNKKEYDAEELKMIRDNYMIMSKKIMGVDAYWNIYNTANDSITAWQQNRLGLWKYYGNTINYQLDSVFCVNEENNKIIFSILRQYLDEDASESIWWFYGVKINEQWYFFKGPTLVLPREFYQEDTHTPLSFEKMKELAAKHIYKGYLKENPLWTGQPEVDEYVINEGFFADLTSVAWCTNCVTQEQWDAAYMKWVNDNWKNKDTTNWEERKK